WLHPYLGVAGAGAGRPPAFAAARRPTGDRWAGQRVGSGKQAAGYRDVPVLPASQFLLPASSWEGRMGELLIREAQANDLPGLLVLYRGLSEDAPDAYAGERELTPEEALPIFDEIARDPRQVLLV